MRKICFTKVGSALHVMLDLKRLVNAGRVNFHSARLKGTVLRRLIEQLVNPKLTVFAGKKQ
jgi:hypothetical protein